MDLSGIAEEAAGGRENVAVALRYRGFEGGWRQNAPFYPASVVKLLYLDFALQHYPRRSAEFERALRDMVVDSSNDATALVVDTLTDTTGGPDLPPDELEFWMAKRQRINRWYRTLGYPGLNACQKTWNEAPYGREKQGYGPRNEWHNSLTAGESLLIFRGMLQRHPAAKDYLRRVPGDPQFDEYLGSVCPVGWTLYSKAGWTSEVRHDVALFLHPNKIESLALAVFTAGASDDGGLIPSIARVVLGRLGILDQAA